MSDFAFRTPYVFARRAGLGAWARALAGKCFGALPVQELQPLNDRLLIDIGIDPRDVPRPSMEEADRLGLIERGWLPSRPWQA